MASGPPASPVPPSGERVDKWLWTVRILKTRTLATEACRAGHVEIADQPVKPSRELRAGETIRVRQGVVIRTLIVRGFPARRIGAKLVAEFCDDLTPPEEFEKARVQPVRHILLREKGAGRPTKKDRRAIDRLFE